MRKSLTISFVLWVCCATNAQAALPPLAELEQRARASLAMRTLDAALEAELRRARLNRANTGPRLYGATGYANSDEIIDESRNRSFGRLSSEVGLRLPVLGSRTDLLAAQQRGDLALRKRAVETELAKRDLIRRLRVAYADYWAAQRLAALSQRYRDNEPQVTDMLRLRTRAGLLLDSDRLEFLASFELARRDAKRAELTVRQALDTLGTLVDGDLTDALRTSVGAARPVYEPRCLAQFRESAWLERDPEMAFLNEQLAAFEGMPAGSRWSGINSELRVGYQLANETTTARNGSSAIVAWTFDVPLDYYSGRRLRSASASADAAHAALERDLRRVELNNAMLDLLARESELEQSLQFARLRLGAADESVRERTLRARRIAGDVMEQLQSARLAHYEAAKNVVDAERRQLYWYADWARFEVPDCAADAHGLPPSGQPTVPEPVSPQPTVATPVMQTASNTSAPASLSAAGSRSLYLWTSEPWLASTPDSVREGLAALRAEAIGTLMVSLDGGQIARYAADPAPLQAFARLAAAEGMTIELLLGESEWIRPQHRAKLMAIVQQLRGTPFQAIHLDLEPDMLEQEPARAAALLPELLRTLEAVRAVTNLPLGLSLHPRYVNAPVGSKTFGERLAALDVEATLMVYVANEARVIEIVQPLLARHPTLRTRVAVSLEHSLPRAESLYHLPADERARRMAAIETSLASKNFLGLSIQPTDPWLASTVLFAAADH